jgi:hypothetical protein
MRLADTADELLAGRLVSLRLVEQGRGYVQRHWFSFSCDGGGAYFSGSLMQTVFIVICACPAVKLLAAR